MKIMEYNKIIVFYWAGGSVLKNLEYKHKEEFLYSLDKMTEIIQTVMKNGYSIMLRPNMGEEKKDLLILIDDGRFTQR